MNILNCKVQN